MGTVRPDSHPKQGHLKEGDATAPTPIQQAIKNFQDASEQIRCRGQRGIDIAQRMARYWALIERALQAEQLTDDGRAAMQRLDLEIQAFASRDVKHRLPAVAVECTAQGVALFGHIPTLKLSDDHFVVLRFNGDEPALGVGGDHGSGSHGQALGGDGQASVAHGVAAPTPTPTPIPIQQAITTAKLAIQRGEAHLQDLMVQAAHGAVFAQPAPVAAADTDIGARFNAWQKVHFASGDQQPLKLDSGDRRFVVQHPSRSMRLCRDCIHFTDREYCDHPSLPVSITTGKPAMSAATCRREGNHAPRGLCGPEGDLFMERNDARGLPERFVDEWLSGKLALPVCPCSAEQLFRAFRRWADLVGGKFPPDQIVFTRMVQRAVDPDRLSYSIRQVDVASGARRSIRVWTPAQSDDKALDIAVCLQDFEAALTRYARGGTSV